MLPIVVVVLLLYYPVRSTLYENVILQLYDLHHAQLSLGAYPCIMHSDEA